MHVRMVEEDDDINADDRNGRAPLSLHSSSSRLKTRRRSKEIRNRLSQVWTHWNQFMRELTTLTTGVDDCRLPTTTDDDANNKQQQPTTKLLNVQQQQQNSSKQHSNDYVEISWKSVLNYGVTEFPSPEEKWPGMVLFGYDHRSVIQLSKPASFCICTFPEANADQMP